MATPMIDRIDFAYGWRLRRSYPYEPNLPPPISTIKGSGWVYGTSGNDSIIGLTGHDSLVGNGGDDTFSGGTFVHGSGGHDVIKGFQAHGASAAGDVVALAGFADRTFDQAVADGHIAQAGADVVITDGANVVATLQHVLLTSLHANDFAFS